jgi:Holliday junction resolvasome RuvABC endonuclease subunit
MNILGIRVEPKSTTFSVISAENENYTIINVELIKIPAALDFPEKLKYIRNCVLDILREYNISIAGIRVAESKAQNLSVTRLHIEGVIQEAFSSSNVEKYFVGRKNSIASKLNMTGKELESVFKGENVFDLIDNWDVCRTRQARESVLTAMGALA